MRRDVNAFPGLAGRIELKIADPVAVYVVEMFEIGGQLGAIVEKLSGQRPVLGPVGREHPATDLSSSRATRKWVRFEMPLTRPMLAAAKRKLRV